VHAHRNSFSFSPSSPADISARSYLAAGKNPRRRIGKLVTVGGLYPIWTAYWTGGPQDGRLDRRVHCAVSTLEIFRSITNSVSSAGWLSREAFLLAQCWGRNSLFDKRIE